MPKTPIREKEGVSISKHAVVKPARVSIRTLDGSVISGNINLGLENRISDVFVKSETPFVVMFDAIVAGKNTPGVYIINKSHIVWVEPEDSELSLPNNE